MTDLREQIRCLQEEANALPEGPTMVALYEEAVRQADSLQDLDLAYELRRELIWAAQKFCPDVMLVAFAWCLAQMDRDPQRFEQHDLVSFYYSDVITAAAGFPEIDRPRIESLLADRERRYVEAGASMHGVHHMRRDVMSQLGDREAAAAAHAAMRKCRADDWSEHPATVACHNLEYHVFQGQWRHAYRAIQPVLEGRLECDGIMPYAHCLVLLPLFHLGHIEEARQHQRIGYRLICRDSHYVKQFAQHITLLVLVGDLAQAKRLVERHLPDAYSYPLLDERFQFLQAARLWTESLLKRGTDRMKVRLPSGTPKPDAQGKCDVGQLGQWFTAEAQAIAHRFDARNGNDYYQQQLDSLPDMLQRAVQ